jgi:hypothetical protein
MKACLSLEKDQLHRETSKRFGELNYSVRELNRFIDNKVPGKSEDTTVPVKEHQVGKKKVKYNYESI